MSPKVLGGPSLVAFLFVLGLISPISSSQRSPSPQLNRLIAPGLAPSSRRGLTPFLAAGAGTDGATRPKATGTAGFHLLAENYSAGSVPYCVAVADFNGDGHLAKDA